ncbi:hypothetical protein WR25_06317 [Diploscapter pachys]|uniref:Saposin A-type domain-containing protein n=1 Tax=Diploscapter pachys TaxID=2018661 RepID=A0A2A2JNX0_9BILA|nr:hypothetical protein WR25_06317 [Diploscapter pachys]
MSFTTRTLAVVTLVVQIVQANYRPPPYSDHSRQYQYHQPSYPRHQTPAQRQQQPHRTQHPSTPASQYDPYRHAYTTQPPYRHPTASTYYAQYKNYPHAQTQYVSQPANPICDIPPDLWCDSPQSAQQCGVQRQCDSLRQSRRPLKVTLIYEALCPFCQKFISNQLPAIFNKFQGQFQLELVPWGNARIMRDGSFSCNHGQKECDANRLQSCVLDILSVKLALPFIVCFERDIGRFSVDQALQSCSAFIRNQYRQIKECYDGYRGQELQRLAAQKTLNTKPNPIMEVPYLLINDYTPSIDNNNLNVLMLPQLLAKWTKMYH